MSAIAIDKQLPTIYQCSEEITSPKWCKAFAEGCGQGGPVELAKLAEGDVAMFGSPRLWGILENAKIEGRTYYYGDHGYFGRGRFYRTTKNAAQHDGTGSAGSDRFHALGLNVKPWQRKKTKGFILICPPSQVFGMLNGFCVEDWLDGIISRVQARSDREIRIRRKPRAAGGPGMREALDGAWALVTWKSNTAIEALLEGVPVFCLGICAASRMGKIDIGEIEDPFYPDDREQFMANLAANQWTLEEMSRGVAWEALNREA